MASRRGSYREPDERERRLLEFLAAKTDAVDSESLSGILVRDMDDGGMGSIELLPRGAQPEAQRIGSVVADHDFLDTDGVSISVALIVDQNGDPFELDVWKVDFSPVILPPDTPRQG